MPLFPNLTTKDFEEIQFFGHVGGAFKDIKAYWLAKNKCCAEKHLWFHNLYRPKKDLHVAMLNIRPAKRGCADFRIFLARKSQGNLGFEPYKDHRMTESDFLGMFKTIVQSRGEDALYPISFTFKRHVKSKTGLFLKLGGMYALEGLKLRGPDSAPISNLSFELVTGGRVLIEVKSKPTYTITEQGLNDRFFSQPLEDMVALSTGLVKKIEESGYAKRKL